MIKIILLGVLMIYDKGSNLRNANKKIKKSLKKFLVRIF